MKKRCLMVGAGGMAGHWIRSFLPPFADRLEVVGLVDVQAKSLEESGDFLNLPPSQRFSDLATAFGNVDADFCAIVIPPAFHREAVMLAVERKMAILSEKPIADSWEACIDVYGAVTRADLKMQVIQNYRFDPEMLTLRQLLRTGDLGRVNYVVGRFADDYRAYGAWGGFRHEIPHALVIDGAVHHFDMLRNLSASDCATIAGWEWNPPWSNSKGEFCNLFVMRMTNDVRATYEGNGTGAGEPNSWHHEYYRAECENGGVSVGRDRIVRIHRYKRGGGLITEEVPVTKPRFAGHLWLIDEFLSWLDGGPTPETEIRDNIKSVAMVFAAIEASSRGQTVDVAAMVDAGIRGRPETGTPERSLG